MSECATEEKIKLHLLLTMTLIVLETVFSFILKHDRVVGTSS